MSFRDALRSLGNSLTGKGGGSSSSKKRSVQSPTSAGLIADNTNARPSSFKKGGLVEKTGMAKVHAGERVLTKQQNKRYSKSRGKC